MQSLDSFISDINTTVTIGLPGRVFSAGIVTEATNAEGKKINVDKRENVVFFDDSYDHFFYHKLRSEAATKLKSPGKTTRYNIKSELSLIVFTRNPDFKEYLISKLSGIKHLDITSIPNEPYKVLLEETGSKEFDFNTYKIFVVNYQALYKSNSCYVLDCAENRF